MERSIYEVVGGAYRKNNITTIELRFNPMKRNRGGEQDLDHIIAAAVRGMDRAMLEYPVKPGLIFCLDRAFPYELNEILVDKAAGRAASAADLFGQLALNINDERDRERFLANGAAGFARPSASGISKTAARTNAIAPSEIASLAAALTPYLGPIAPIVAERESRACTNTEELRRRLAALISAERDRSAFLKRATVPD